MDFSRKRILVTGSTTGIGRGAVQMLLEAGATVAINGREQSTVVQVIKELGGTRLVAALGDLETVESCRSVVQTAMDALGGLDCLVINSEVYPLASLEAVTEEHWDKVIAANLRPALFCTRFAAPALRASKGNVVIVASIAGLTAGPESSFIYAIACGGLINMTRGLALELASDGVRVNCVCHGYVDAPLAQGGNVSTNEQIGGDVRTVIPLGRAGTVRECASSILYLASADAGYATGTVLVNDGGCTAAASRGGARSGEQTNAARAAYTPTPLPR